MVLVKLLAKLEEVSWLSWVMVVILGVYIFIISSMNFPGGGAPGLGIKAVLYHIGVFFLFSFFLMVALVKGKKLRLALAGVLISILYAVSDEVHQLFVPGRSGSIGDVLLDSTGIGFAFLVYFISVRYRQIRNLD
jgi:hypothetical protein